MITNGKEKVAEFLLCYHLHDESQSNPVHATEQCFNRMIGGDWNDMHTCHNNENHIILDEMKNLTDKLVPELTYVPHITINNLFYPQAETDFMRTVCDHYTVS